jgi:hypothetical protein
MKHFKIKRGHNGGAKHYCSLHDFSFESDCFKMNGCEQSSHFDSLERGYAFFMVESLWLSSQHYWYANHSEHKGYKMIWMM